MKHKIAVLFVLALAIATPAYAALLNVVNLAATDELPVWCPTGYTIKIRAWNARQDGRKALLYCVPAPSATPLPPLQSPLVTPRPTEALHTMPTQ